MTAPGAARRPAHLLLTVAVVLVATVVAYLGVLGWDQHKTVGPDGFEHGPYEPWQVVAVGAVIAAVAVWCGLRRAVWTGTVTATVVLTVCWSVDAASGGDADGLWPIGAFLVACGTFGGFFAVAVVARSARRGRAGEARPFTTG
ncbi:hypothetical protein [Jatrophihabitans endophyticus]|uniref:hypothetical protein n=1 Tax=Jatrophihabitans endophyticus TaxID=1206085 RepID=UPI0009327740|nr:hypothetical protein [Jatrophihabitans endophyticus]